MTRILDLQRFAWPLACCLVASPAFGQFTYPNCDNLAASQFRVVELARNQGLQEPVQFDIQAIWNPAGDSVIQTNFYFAQRMGDVKFYNGATNTTTLVGHIDVWGRNDNALMGLALDPDFNSNRYLYLWYTPPIANANLNRRMRLSRFTVAADNRSLGSEKILLEILGSKTDTWHCGGPMAFDAHGDLWVTVGNNARDVNACGEGSHLSPTDSTCSNEWGSSNTASIRGGIIRIRPDNSTTVRNHPSGKYGPGYSIPAGNFGEYWAQQFQSQGKTALAAEYRDANKVLPELYVKGSRSNYSIALHPTKRWVAWSEVNYQSSFDEFNVTTRPEFAGFPYFHANNARTPTATHNPSAPRNTNPLNSGVTDLPPAMPGTFNYNSSTLNANVAITGPIYVYDRNLKSSVKLPPHFDHHWFLMSFEANRLFVAGLDPNTAAVTRQPVQVHSTLFPTLSLRGPLQAKIGPDGAMYLLNYDGFYSTNSPAISKITYVGACRTVPVAQGRSAGPRLLWTASGLSVRDAGEHVLALHDPSGRERLRLEGKGAARYDFSAWGRQGLEPGVYLLSVQTPGGRTSRRIVLP